MLAGRRRAHLDHPHLVSASGRILRGLGAGGISQRLQLFLGSSATGTPAAQRRYYGMDVGKSLPSDVKESSSSTGRDIEIVVVFNTPTADKRRVLEALNALKYYLLFDGWPPA